MLCDCWKYDRVSHFELVPDDMAVGFEHYSRQLNRVYPTLKARYPASIKHSGVVFLQDNTGGREGGRSPSKACSTFCKTLFGYPIITR